MAKKKRPSRLWLGMAIYALVFLVLAGIGLGIFWNFIDAYEKSRVQTTMDAYMAQLSTDKLADIGAKALQVDTDLQSLDQCKEYIKNNLSGGISYARKLSECNEQQTVYMLLSGRNTIGKVTLTTGEKDNFGFAPWSVAEESFDFSYLKKDFTTVTLTVPHDYTIYIGSNPMLDSHIIQDDIPYTALKEFYSDYDLPHLVTYGSGQLLGEHTVTVKDAQGNEVAIDDIPGEDAPPATCTQDEIAAIEAVAEPFTKYYVDFTSYKDHNSSRNVRHLAQYMVPDGALEKRMYDAIESLSWIVDRKSEITSRTYHHYVKLDNTHYLCDMTYEVNTSNFAGAAHATNNVKLILVQTDDGLKVEAMASY